MGMQAIAESITPRPNADASAAPKSALTRRLLLSAAAAVPAAAVPAAAIVPATAMAASSTEPDPIFAVIEAWRAAEEFTERCVGQDDIDRAADAAHEFALDMAETMPTTVLGCAALAEAIARDFNLGGVAWHKEAVQMIAKSLRTIGAMRANS